MGCSLYSALHVIQKCSQVWSPKAFLAWLSSPILFSFPGWSSILFQKSTQGKMIYSLNQVALHYLGSIFSYIICLNHECSLCFSAPSAILFPVITTDHFGRTFSLPLSNSLSSCFSTTHSGFTKYDLLLTLCFFKWLCLTSSDELQISCLIHHCILLWALHRVSTQ